VKDPAESAALDKYKGYLRAMEANLPVEERYKNFARGAASPIVVADQVHGGGDNVPGVQTIAFNLPNDERVREAKGAKKVILANVLGAKYQRILQPMAGRVLVSDQAGRVTEKYMTMFTLFHELSHSLGPGFDHRERAPDHRRQGAEGAQLRHGGGEGRRHGRLQPALHDAEGRAARGRKDQLFATYLAGLFRAMRFGVDEAHGRGAALQYDYLKGQGAFAWDARERRIASTARPWRRR
jgi:hypothetical protein